MMLYDHTGCKRGQIRHAVIETSNNVVMFKFTAQCFLLFEYQFHILITKLFTTTPNIFAFIKYVTKLFFPRQLYKLNNYILQSN